MQQFSFDFILPLCQFPFRRFASASSKKEKQKKNKRNQNYALLTPSSSTISALIHVLKFSSSFLISASVSLSVSVSVSFPFSVSFSSYVSQSPVVIPLFRTLLPSYFPLSPSSFAFGRNFAPSFSAHSIYVSTSSFPDLCSFDPVLFCPLRHLRRIFYLLTATSLRRTLNHMDTFSNFFTFLKKKKETMYFIFVTTPLLLAEVVFADPPQGLSHHHRFPGPLAIIMGALGLRPRAMSSPAHVHFFLATVHLRHDRPTFPSHSHPPFRHCKQAGNAGAGTPTTSFSCNKLTVSKGV
jgi:hypothetical protein